MAERILSESAHGTSLSVLKNKQKKRQQPSDTHVVLESKQHQTAVGESWLSDHIKSD